MVLVKCLGGQWFPTSRAYERKKGDVVGFLELNMTDTSGGGQASWFYWREGRLFVLISYINILRKKIWIKKCLPYDNIVCQLKEILCTWICSILWASGLQSTSNSAFETKNKTGGNSRKKYYVRFEVRMVNIQIQQKKNNNTHTHTPVYALCFGQKVTSATPAALFLLSNSVIIKKNQFFKNIQKSRGLQKFYTTASIPIAS